MISGCASNSSKNSSTSETVKIQSPSRDEELGPNRAIGSVTGKSKKPYIFRNVASAFPDNGKNMMLKDRALPKSAVSGALDQSPRQLRAHRNQQNVAKNKSRFSNINKAYYANPLSQREALVLAQSSKNMDLAEFSYQVESSARDDAFETNDTRETAFDLSNVEDRWLGLMSLSEIPSEGVQADEDWYKIKVSSQYKRLMVDLRFQHYLGDIDLKLYDSAGNLVAISQGLGEDEFIHVMLERGGVYYIQIYGSNRHNRYDLKFSTYFTGGGDDDYEDNDSLASAYDLRKFENQWLSEIQGEGVAADDDYYRIQVPAGREHVQIDLRCDVNRGDVDVRLLNAQGKVIASSAHIGDDDFIDFTVPSPGTYFVKIYPFSPQSTFNLYDFKWVLSKSSRNRMASVK